MRRPKTMSARMRVKKGYCQIVIAIVPTNPSSAILVIPFVIGSGDASIA
jgi:hypothetical protein